MWMLIAKDSPQVILLPGDCLEHAAHLVGLQALKTADWALKMHGRDWKYFSSLATSSHTFRDLSKNLFETWCEQHGDLSGVQCAKKLWPKLVAGRWNSCAEVEERMQAVGGRAMMLPVLEAVLLRKKKLKRKMMRNNLHKSKQLQQDLSMRSLSRRLNNTRKRCPCGEKEPFNALKIPCGGSLLPS